MEAILRLAREMRLVPQIEFISFSRHACDEVLRLQPDAVVVYVSSDMAAMSPAEAKSGDTEVSPTSSTRPDEPVPNWSTKPTVSASPPRLMVNDRELIDRAARHGITYVSTGLSRQGRSLSGSRRSLKNKK